jgi:hypothetical protein
MDIANETITKLVFIRNGVQATVLLNSTAIPLPVRCRRG